MSDSRLATAVPSPAPEEAATAGRRRRRLLREGADARAVLFRAAIVVVVIYGLVAVDDFGTVANFRALLSSIAIVGIAAIGMSYVTISGNLFMLSVGSTIAAGSIIFSGTVGPLTLVPALLLTVLAGGVLGAAQGVIVARFGGDPIITTIAFASVTLGVGDWLAAGNTVVAEGDVSVLRSDLFDVVPVEGAFFVVIAVAAHYVLRRTRFGRQIQLIGENRDAARIAGLPVARTIVAAYVFAAACGALAATLLSSQSGQGTLETGVGIDFDAIAVILVGGVAVTGGRGSIADVAFGALFIGLVANLLAVSGGSYSTQLLVKGVIVLLAVALAGLGSRMREEAAT